MRRFDCPGCSASVFFENDRCLSCGTPLVYSPLRGQFTEPGTAGVSLCANGLNYGVCNWAAEPGSDRCMACLPNVEIPDLGVPGNRERWLEIEQAKRRLFYTLLDLGQRSHLIGGTLRFSFIASTEREDVTTGHDEGHITLDIAEAEDAERVRRQGELGEDYRTVLGHLRHEIGHYFWFRCLTTEADRAAFRVLFGDERAAYGDALERHYQSGPPSNWRDTYISAYATAHPHEDWAECFAHYLHLSDTFDTAIDIGLVPPHTDAFSETLERWCELTVKLNQLGRSMGFRDLYPFVIVDAVRDKLAFVHDVLAVDANPGAGESGALAP